MSDRRMPRANARIDPWEGPCPICGETITNETSGDHLFEHGIHVCGRSPDGLSQRGVEELARFHERLQRKARERRAER